jgi:outer membrane scaffolding protein for murein synthesis (MipA/OmpV family)
MNLELNKTLSLYLLLFSLHGQCADFETLPLWELGVGAAHVNLPQYVGSDQRTRGSLPFPYFVYRGEAIKISRDSMSGRLFKRADFLIDLSADISLPVDSGENHAREGMPDIDFVLEVGPAARYILHRNIPQHRTVSVEVPLRIALQSNLRYVAYEGWRINPRLRYQDYFGHWRLSLWAGVYWNGRRYNDLYYGVEPEDATSLRPAYETSSGYGGWAVSTSLSYRRGDWWVGGFFRWYDSGQAEFHNSPLAIQSTNPGFGLAAAWVFSTASRHVPRWD